MGMEEEEEGEGRLVLPSPRTKNLLGRKKFGGRAIVRKIQ